MTSGSIDSGWITPDHIKSIKMYSGPITEFHKWHKYHTSEEIMQWIQDYYMSGIAECDCILCEEKRQKENDNT